MCVVPFLIAMKLKILQSVASPEFAYRPGDIAEFKGAVARDFIARGIAEKVRQAPIETAVTGPAETAVTRKPRGRGMVERIKGLF